MNIQVLIIVILLIVVAILLYCLFANKTNQQGIMDIRATLEKDGLPTPVSFDASTLKSVLESTK